MFKLWRLLPLSFFLIISLFLWRGLQLDPQKIPLAQINKPLPNFNLPNLLSPQKKLLKNMFVGQVSFLNVWASWCAACIEEQELLLQLQTKGIPIYGLNYKDYPAEAKKWLVEWGNPYQAIASDITGKTAINLGVYGAPETFLIDKKGIIRYRHVGIIDQKSWDKTLYPLYQYYKEH